MNFTWFHLVIVFIFTSSASKIIQKSALRDDLVDPTAYSAFFLFVVSLFTVPFLFAEHVIISSSPIIWLAVFLSGALYTAGTVFYYHALKSTEISQVETISTTRSIWMLLLGVIFFHEALIISKLFGVFLIFGGLTVIYWNPGKPMDFGKPQLFTLLSTFFICAASALDKYAIVHFSVGFYQVVIYLIPAILTTICIPGTWKKIRPLMRARKTTYIILIACFLQMIGTLSLYRAYQIGGELSVVGPLSQSSTVLTITIGMVLFKERWNLKRKIAGIVLVVLGVVFVKVISL